jgi:hypothetical protein
MVTGRRAELFRATIHFVQRVNRAFCADVGARLVVGAFF